VWISCKTHMLRHSKVVTSSSLKFFEYPKWGRPDSLSRFTGTFDPGLRLKLGLINSTILSYTYELFNFFIVRYHCDAQRNYSNRMRSAIGHYMFGAQRGPSGAPMANQRARRYRPMHVYMWSGPNLGPMNYRRCCMYRIQLYQR
jgi:hypothetical protein